MEKPQTAHPMSFTWTSHIAASMHYRMQNLYPINSPAIDHCVGVHQQTIVGILSPQISIMSSSMLRRALRNSVCYLVLVVDMWGNHTSFQLVCVNFISLVNSYVGLWEEEPQTAQSMSFTWVSYIAASMLTGCSTLRNQSNAHISSVLASSYKYC